MNAETAIKTLAYQKQGSTDKLIEYAKGVSALFIVDVVQTKSLNATRWTVWNRLTQVRSGETTIPDSFRGSLDPKRNQQIILDYIRSKFHLG